MHFIEHGVREERDPSPSFSTRDWLDRYPHLRDTGANPLLHALTVKTSDKAPPPTKATQDERLEHDPDPLSDVVHTRRDELAELRASRLFDQAYYCALYPDVLTSDLSPLEHYCSIGWREHRDPNPYFDTDWYLRANPDVADLDVNPVWHYFSFGEAEGRQPSPIFDPAFYASVYLPAQPRQGALADYLAHLERRDWRNPVEFFDVEYYLAANADVKLAGIDPVLHYVTTGHSEGRDPSARFRTSYYRAKYLRGDSHINPLMHYYETGRHYGFFVAPGPHDLDEELSAQFRHWSNPGPDFEEFDPSIASGVAARAKLVAFYLPQYHPIPENDRAWGKGFTEWRNVMRGLPRFTGHYQPRIPRDLGFYNLADSDILRAQVALARQAGLHGFSFYYYWFNGKRLLERPLERFLSDSSLDFAFCVTWANENWTRRWDGHDTDVLIRQEYRPEDDVALVDDVQRHFADPRYIRIGGRPLFVIYRLDVVPDGRRALSRWRTLWRDRHGEQPLIFLAQGFGNTDPAKYGADGGIEFPPHELVSGKETINSKLRIVDPTFSGHVHDYDAAVDDALRRPRPAQPLIRTAVPSWDNDARRQGSGMVLHGSTPEKYEQWLRTLVDQAQSNPVYGERIVFVNAWNEWAEAAYLEPDVHYGAAYLNATARAISGQPRAGSRNRILLVGHDAHAHGAQINLWHMANTLVHQFGCEVAFLLLEGGALVPDYERLGTVCVTSGDEGRASVFASDLRGAGWHLCITNTAVTGALVPMLKDAGFSVLSLVHELPGLIEDYGLEHSLSALLRESDSVVVAADVVRDGISAYGPDATSAKILVRPQGLYHDSDPPPRARTAVRRELGIPHGARVVLNVGFGDMRKGIDIFFHVAKAALTDTHDLHFVWVGDLHQEADRWLRRDLTGLLAEHVHFVPHTTEVNRYYAAADVFFLSSREDPYPSVVLEALRAELPVVALRGSGGAEELAARFGDVVDRADIQAIVQALHTHAHDRRSSVKRARRRVIEQSFRYDEYCFELLRLLSPSLKKVSVVVPNYNYAGYLSDRIADILAQTYPIFEIIVLDDASTDESVQELERIASTTDRKFRIIRNRANSGSPFHQWRKACDLATGDYLWIAEADDRTRPQFLQRVISRLDSPDVQYAFTDSAQIDEAGQHLGDSYKPYYRAAVGDLMDSDFTLDGQSFVRACLAERNLVLNASAVVWKRTALRASLARCLDALEVYRLAGDWHLYAETAAAGGDVAYVAEPLNIHRRHRDSVTGALDKRRHLEEVRIVHNAICQSLEVDDALTARMKTYEKELEREFGLARRRAPRGNRPPRVRTPPETDTRLHPPRSRGSGKPARPDRRA